MASAALHGFFDIQPASAVTSPPAAHRKDISQARHAPSEFELDNLTFGKCYNGPVESGAQTPKTPNELEMSRPPSPVGNDAVPIMQSWNNPPMNKWRILCCCLIYLGNGINDSGMLGSCPHLSWYREAANTRAVIGALIPYMEVYYRIGYAVMSMVFVGNAAGFIVAAFFTNTTLGRLGRAKTLMLAEVIMMSAYIMLVATPPYPVVVIA